MVIIVDGSTRQVRISLSLGCDVMITVSYIYRVGPENEVSHESEWSTYEERKAKHRVRRSV